MPSVTAPNERDKQIMQENHLDPKNYGVLYRDADCIRLLCYETRDMLTIKVMHINGITTAGHKAPSDWEKLIMRENGLDPEKYLVMRCGSGHIGLLSIDSGSTVTIWKGDRLW